MNKALQALPDDASADPQGLATCAAVASHRPTCSAEIWPRIR